MVDYKLIIDIDEHELVKKLTRALKNIPIGAGMSGGSGSGGGYMPGMKAHMGGMAQQGSGATLTEAGARRVAEWKDKQDIFGNRQHNKINLEFAKKEHLENLRYGHRMEVLSKASNQWSKKMFSAGTVVKLAGLATGVAGLLQFRKMIIDSSPMLQAMLKIMHVAVQFTLRPIGDFIGFVLRPLLIPFLLAAVKFYKNIFPHVMEHGTAAGEALAEGRPDIAVTETAKLTTDIYQEILDERYGRDVEYWEKVKALYDAELNNPYGRDAIGSFIQSVWDTLTLDLHSITQQAGAQEGAGAYHDVQLKETMKIQDAVKAGINHSLQLKENLGFKDEVDTEHIVTYSKQMLQIFQNMKDQGFGAEAESLKTNVLSNRAEIAMKKMGVTDPAGSNRSGNYAKSGFMTGGFTATQGDADATQALIEQAEEQRDLLDKNHRNTDSINKKIGDLQDLLDRELNAIYGMAGGFEDGSARVTVTNFGELLGEATGGTIGGGSGGGGGGRGGSTSSGGWRASNGKVYGSYQEAVDNSPGKTVPIGGNKTGPNPNYKEPVEVNAAGGVITEEIQGVGKKTGKRYSFGEAGDEAIIPINQFYEMAARLKRIGAGTSIPSSLQNEGVGMFTGVTAFGLNRSIEKYNEARDLKEANMGALQEKMDLLQARAAKIGDTGGNTRSSASMQRAYKNRAKRLRINKDSASVYKQMRGLTEGESSAKTEFSDLFSQARGNTTEGSTWNNNISISVNDASGSIDSIIQKIGPKLLKYLQENEARIGIR